MKTGYQLLSWQCSLWRGLGDRLAAMQRPVKKVAEVTQVREKDLKSTSAIGIHASSSALKYLIIY